MIRVALRLFTIAAVGWLGMALAAAWAQERLLFPGAYMLPRGPEQDLRRQVLATELGARPIDLTTRDGVRVLAWLYQPGTPRPTVLYMGGNGMPIEVSRGIAAAADEAGWDLMAVGPRGFPGSEGSPSADGFVRDLDAAWAWLTGPGGRSPDHIVLHGRSMGGGAAAAFAAGVQPAGLVLESTFTSLAGIAAEHWPLMPVRLLLRHQYETEQVVRGLRVPVLVTHSDRDETVPFHHGERLGALADRWLPVRGLTHGQSPLTTDPTARAAWAAWLAEIRGTSGGP